MMELSASKKRVLEFCRAKNMEFNAFWHNYIQCYQKLIGSIAKQLEKDSSSPTKLVGLCAPQGAGKSTLVELFKIVLQQEYGLNVVTLSLDDFYKTRAERQVLANRVHPLLSTRGVPGTHDVELAISTLLALKKWKTGSSVTIPRFDKAIDDRRAASQCQKVTSAVDLILFEGWCINAKPQKTQELAHPINQLEEQFDSEAIWRTYTNDALGDRYQDLFNLIDFSIVFYPPSFETVCQWRLQQEQQLVKSLSPPKLTNHSTMNPQEMTNFMMHFERISRHLYINTRSKDKHSQADLLKIQLDERRNTTFIT